MKHPNSNQSETKFMFISDLAKNGGLGTCPLGAGAS